MDSTKDLILESLRRNRQAGEYPYPDIPDFPKSGQPILDEFKQSLTEGGGAWREAASATEAERLIRELHPDAKVICSAAPEIRGNRDIHAIKDPHELEDVDVGVIRARFGIAETGMVWLTQEDLKVDALGVLSQHLVILLNPQQLVRDMYEAYGRIDLQATNYGCFMLGPSATADIGAFMVRGAQGARSLTVIFL